MSVRTGPVLLSSGRIDALALRARLGYREWGVPTVPDLAVPGFAWMISTREGYPHGRIIVSTSDTDPRWIGDTPGQVRDGEWVHASISRLDQMPTYADLAMLHDAVWGGTGWSYQAFAPTEHHINIHEHTLHLWGRVDGSPVLPNFGARGSI